MQHYDEETIVIKYGGHAMGERNSPGVRPRHRAAGTDRDQSGGGAWRRPADRDDAEAARHQVGVRAGLRITDAATIEIVEMVLAGSINKQIVGYINEAGGKAVGLCGKDGNMVIAEKATRTMVDPDSNIEKAVDLGFVGEPEKVDLTLLNQLIGYELIPVLAPLAVSKTARRSTSTPTPLPAPSPAR